MATEQSLMQDILTVLTQNQETIEIAKLHCDNLQAKEVLIEQSVNNFAVIKQIEFRLAIESK